MGVNRASTFKPVVVHIDLNPIPAWLCMEGDSAVC